MKKIFIPLVAFLMLLGLHACKEKEVGEGPLPVLDFRLDIPGKEVAVQNLGKVRYFRLHTPDSILLGDQTTFVPGRNSLFFFNKSTGDVVGFDKEGELIGSFNRKGQSGEEYAQIRLLDYDDERKEVFLSPWEKNQFQVYGLDGNYKRTLPFSDSIRLEGIVSLDKNTFVLLDMNNVPFVKDGGEIDRSATGQAPDNRPFVLMDKETGLNKERLPIVSEDRFHSFLLTMKEGRPFLLLGRLKYLFAGNDECLLSEPAADTIYSISSERHLKPAFTRLPSTKDKEGRIACEVRAYTPKTMLINALFIRQEGFDRLRSELYLYNVPEKTFSVSKLLNADWKGADLTNNPIFSNNKLYYILYPHTLLEAKEKNELSGELLEITQTLNEDENLILMEVTLE